MNAVSIGPLLFSADRFAAIVGIAVFWLAMVLVGRLVGTRYGRAPLGDTAFVMILIGAIGARAGHVGLHFDSFAGDPGRVLYFWQGGFALWGGLAGLVLVAVWTIRTVGQAAGTAGATLAGIGAWMLVLLMTQQTTDTPLPETALQRFQGGTAALAEYEGQPMVVNFWATWCPPCVREMPLLGEAADASPDIAFLFVNQGEGIDEIAAFLDRQGLDLSGILLDPGWRMSTHYDAPGLPTTLFIDAEGAVQAVHVGEISREHLAGRLADLRRTTAP